MTDTTTPGAAGGGEETAPGEDSNALDAAREVAARRAATREAATQAVDILPKRAADGRLRRLAELLALTGFAVAQPVLDVTGKSPDFFLYRRPTTGQLWLLLAIVVFGPPLALWVAELVVGVVSRTAARLLHLVFVAGLLATVVVQVGKQGGYYGRRLAAVAFVAGCAAAIVIARSPRVRQVLLYASPAPLVFVLAFALTAPAGALLRPAKADGGLAASTTTRPPIVVLVLDEFPTRALLDDKGAVDGRLFPNFARLAAASTWYPNATALSGYTPFAVPPIVTGKKPGARVAPAYVEYPDNLFTLLGDAYRMHAYESISQFCPPQYCEDVSAGRATGLRPMLTDTVDIAKEVVSPRRPKPREGEEFAERPVEQAPAKGSLGVQFRFSAGKANQPERVTSFVAGLGAPADKPTLSFLHLLLPHIPFRYLPSGMRYGEHPPSFPLGRGKIGDTARRNPEPGAMAIQQQRELLQLVYVDTLLGQMIDKLEKAGTWDDSLVVLTADHGAGWVAGEKARHLDANNAPDLAYVPLFVKTPDQAKGGVDERNAMTMDVLPTIADVLDEDIPFRVDGVSLLGTPRPDLAKVWYDDPGKPLPVDGARWAPFVRRGIAPTIAMPQDGPKGLFKAGMAGHLVGRKVSELTVGAKSPVVATSLHPEGWNAVKRESGAVPALLWGNLSAPLGPRAVWLAVSVNGTIAGSVLAAAGQAGTWHFVGLAADEHFTNGANDVRLYTVAGTTLHPLDWATS